MNVNSGGPHLLLFERDQQLTALLTREFQLAGYECHAARTAVEVFDAIARFPVRLVLVNLAQPAAGRREFWVALDAQRRGRGVQVFTFRCMNLAGYGADDPDERARTVLADIEVDGMPGVMNLVDAVRARIPGPTTGSNPRLPATPVASRQAGTREAGSASAPQVAVTSAPSITGQVTSPLPLLVSNGISNPSVPPSQSASTPALQRPQPSAPRLPASSMSASPPIAPSVPPPSFSPTTPTISPLSAGPGNTPPGFADMYASSRNFSQIPAGQETGGDQMSGQLPASQVGFQQNQPPANPSGNETGLEQLSRMIREQAPPMREQEAQQNVETRLSALANGAPINPSVPQPSVMQDSLPGGQGTQRPADSPPINTMSLRASPIQDIAIERESGRLASAATNRQTASQEAEPSIRAMSGVPINSFAPQSTPILPSAPVPAVSPQDSMSASPPLVVSTSASSAMSKPALGPAPKSAQTPGSMSTSTPELIEPENEDESSSSFTEDRPSNGVAPSTVLNVVTSMEAQRERVSNPSRPAPVYRPEENSIDRTFVESPLADALKANMQGVIRRNEAGTNVSSDETLLNIVQSFPPMPASAQSAQQIQPPVLSGRATRSLGSVLLEGHLVPQHRLEVAQHIQHMLRGVDMNYQLGEILLIFKLLTPDQLLAASLVSYGLISTMQISALGRIRQELHAIGLEYDLESLLVLFRILSPEQLREVRASWSG